MTSFAHLYTHCIHIYLHIHLHDMNMHIYTTLWDSSCSVSGTFTWRIKLNAIRIVGRHYLKAFIKHLTSYHTGTHHFAKKQTFSFFTLEDPRCWNPLEIMQSQKALPNFLPVHQRLIQKRSCPFTDQTNHRESLLNSNWQVIWTFQ